MKKYKALRGAIRAKFDTQEAFARAVNISPATLSLKLSGKSEWSRCEMERCSKVLGLSADQIYEYFFAQ